MAAIDPGARRYARQRVLPGFGTAGQERLAAAHVVVLGAGGLGSAVIPPLAAAGIGRLTIVDDDRVEVTNLHRQTLHADADLGRPKVDSATDAAALLAPDAALRGLMVRFDEGNADELLADADVVVDGTDDLDTLYLADAAAARAGIPLVWGSAARFSGQVGVSWEARGISYRDLFPEPPADAGLSCEIDGILPTVCTVTGGLMAGEVLKLLTGIGEPLVGRVAVYDALTGRTREIAYARDPSSSASGGRAGIPLGARKRHTHDSRHRLPASVVEAHCRWRRSCAVRRVGTGDGGATERAAHVRSGRRHRRGNLHCRRLARRAGRRPHYSRAHAGAHRHQAWCSRLHDY